MRKIVMLLIIMAVAIIYTTSCARGISPYDAANGKAKCGRYLR